VTPEPSVSHLHAILDNIPDIAWLKDEESRFIAINGALAAICGQPKEAVVGKTDFDFWPRELAERYRADDREVMRTGQRKSVEEPLVDARGKRIWIETTKTPVLDDSGRVIGTAGIARDVTDRKDKLRALEELSAEVAHQVGNLLALVRAHAELIDHRTADPELKALVGACRQAIDDGARSLRRVLVAARREASPAAPRQAAHARLDVSAHETVILTRPRWQDAALARGLRYEVDTSALAAVPDVALDTAQARDIVLNLLLNALDALPHGGTIALATSVEQGAVVLAVDDSGPGVPLEARTRIFEPFTTSKGADHAGIGLSVVARLVREAKGTVRVLDSRLGGARFEVRLPSITVEAEPAAADVAARSLSILLVEDEPALGRAMSALLALRGHEVAMAGDVESALAMLESHPDLDVLITDLGLPTRSGWELVESVRSSRPTLPIVVLSGWGSLTDPGEARARGVAAVLTKPTSDAELARVLEELAGR
jgi:PAS domain S-box-containing protein